MDIKKVYDNLCVYDKRNEFYQDTASYTSKEDIPKARDNCHCDNCFYGRDELALEILRLRGDNEKEETS